MTTSVTTHLGVPPQTRANAMAQATWRTKGIVVIRIAMGLIWVVNAWLKWQPDFIQNFSGYLTKALDGQPPAIQSWINFWQAIMQIDSTAFAVIVAILETALAISLIFGLFSNVGYVGGVLLSLIIWSVAEGFGGPYGPGSTDIGAAIIYVPVFALLFFSSAGLYWGVDGWLTSRLGRWGFLASAPLPADKNAK